jgi:hypothetical protein
MLPPACRVYASAVPLTYSTDPTRDLVVVTGVGTVTLDDSLRTIRAVAAETSSHQCGSLTDVRAMDYYPSVTELKTIAIEFIRLRASFRCGVAFVVSNDKHFGLGKLLSALVDPAGLRIGVFHDSAAAEAWLRANHPDGPRPPAG